MHASAKLLLFRALARKNGYRLHYNREIIALGLANVAGAMSNCYTTTGSFSRSAVNNNAGKLNGSQLHLHTAYRY